MILPFVQAKPPRLPNAEGDRGLAGWTVEGDAESLPDLLTDPMHPDDTVARVYAQAIVATLSQP